MIEGLILILLGYEVWKHTRPKPHGLLTEELHERMNANDTLRSQEVDELKRLLTEYTRLKQNLTEEIALNRQVTKEAVEQSERAKAALVAILRTSGCDDAQIDKVLEKVESPEK